MFKGDYKWQHDYVRLAFDTGFKFEKQKLDDFDKNKISLIDVDRIVEERDIATVEKLIPGITKFVLDPDQAQLLDVSFVKTIKLSQLAIQYLLFCKKYLDNTVIALKDELKKLREENKELHLFVDDLKEHISQLMKEIDQRASFKCDQCNKVFSTEEFLNSHIKRRHSLQQEPETEKIQMEIKELKGRLNNAEKMIQKEHEIESNISKEVDVRKLEDLQQKFEDLRLQVQSELKILQTQHNFQEKYEKLFEKMIIQGGGRRESTTQTDLGAAGVVFEEKNKENVPELSNTQKQITQVGEALEIKVISSLQKIENQMQTFWDKLNEMEVHETKPSIKPRSKYTVKNIASQQEEESISLEKQEEITHIKPKSKFTAKDIAPQQQEGNISVEKQEAITYIKPRSKIAVKNIASQQEEENISVEKQEDVTNIKPRSKYIVINVATHQKESLEKQEEITYSSPKRDKVMIAQPQIQVVNPKTVEKIEPGINLPEINDDTTTSETLASVEITSESPEVVKPQPVLRKRGNTRKNVKSEFVIDDELLKHFKLEIENILKARLQDLGVSPDWKGLPHRSFQRALEIVNHQANLAKKNYSNFDLISSQIEKDVAKKIDIAKRQQKNVTKLKPKKTESRKVRGKVASPQIEIKNRQMYDTDSESEVRPIKVQENLKQFSAPYSAVIEELKTVTSIIDADSDSVKEEKVVKEDQTKGVLKSFPSVGSLTKKKVLFNLDTEDKKIEENGSTTSIASSLLDGTPREETKKKEIEDLSDFDFSDM